MPPGACRWACPDRVGPPWSSVQLPARVIECEAVASGRARDRRTLPGMRGLAIIAIAGCGRVAFDPLGGASGGPSDAAVIGATDAPSAIGTDAAPGGTGSGTISGTPPLGMFPSVMAAYVVGHPQFAGDTAIYLLSQP